MHVRDGCFRDQGNCPWRFAAIHTAWVRKFRGTFPRFSTEGEPKRSPKAAGASNSPRRSGASDPLTARVIVNRVWQSPFRDAASSAHRATSGQVGERPSHPEPLEYLAARFVKNGMSIKQLQREMSLGDVSARHGILQGELYERRSQSLSMALYRTPPRRRSSARFAVVCLRRTR